MVMTMTIMLLQPILAIFYQTLMKPVESVYL